jgi:hypothetical protein
LHVKREPLERVVRAVKRRAIDDAVDLRAAVRDQQIDGFALRRARVFRQLRVETAIFGDQAAFERDLSRQALRIDIQQAFIGFERPYAERDAKLLAA